MSGFSSHLEYGIFVVEMDLEMTHPFPRRIFHIPDENENTDPVPKSSRIDYKMERRNRIEKDIISERDDVSLHPA